MRLKIDLENVSLGGKRGRITEFYPKTGRMLTYFADSPQKTII
jgi:chemotaxis receptor (MCP) glutamine deamidase CheD